MNKEAMTIELAMRFAVLMRTPSLIASNGRMLSFDPAKPYGLDRFLDRDISRFAVEMAKEYVENFHAAIYGPPPGPASQGAMQRAAPKPADDISDIGEAMPWGDEMDATVRAMAAEKAKKPDIEAP